MSNIPPDPPDPPSSNNVVVTLHANDSNNTASARRGRGRNNRGRRRAPPADRDIRNDPGPQPVSSSRKTRPRQPQSSRNAATNKSEADPAENIVDIHKQESPRDNAVTLASDSASTSKFRSPKSHSNKRGQFGAQLTQAHGQAQNRRSTRAKSPPPDSDLATRLIYSLKTPPYLDCPICFNTLHPSQPIWSCSVGDNVTSCCWTSFHLKCIKDWAKRSVKDVRDALQARNTTNETEYWRCPGCQTKRTSVPGSYLCFCGSMTDPKPGAATPHSCGSSCARKRLACEHPCPLSCHPGPCPPCSLTVYVPCHCGRVINAVRCGSSRSTNESSNSCGGVCGRRLACQTHFCNQPCHPGNCAKCEKLESVTCYCGQSTKVVECGSGLESAREAYVLDSECHEIRWSGRFDCGGTCGRNFDCNLHKCPKPCHVPSPTPIPCPFDPIRVSTCPCGKRSLSDISNTPRVKCTDPIPSCQGICGKPLEGCSHPCAEICHNSPCLPCQTLISIPCRCGLSLRQIPCHERQKDSSQQQPFVCDKVCAAMRLCGRHQCSRVCCPLGSISRNKPNKSKKKIATQRLNEDLEDSERLWHTCDFVCGKTLSCGLHRCEEPDHRGPCPPCLQSSFEEMVCHCQRTVFEPPIPCGTVMSCNFPCTRPPPPCGHEKAPHQCHEDPAPCPPCPFLTSKPCSCGKRIINNIRCSQETVLCGQPCGKLLDCGFHKCKRSCHGDPCGPCPSVCGKPRKLCLPDCHPCTLPCHAPSACNESEPCGATITVSCPCGRFQQPTKCGRSFSNPGRTAPQLQCRDECAIAKRNAKLAEALGISSDRKEKSNVVYSDEQITFAKTNVKFATAVVNTLNEFVNSDKKTQILPYTPPNRRKFVLELCHLYRTDTQLVDPEPRRSIQIFKRIDTRIPTPLLTSCIVQSNQASLGKLADLRRISPRPSTVFSGSSSSRAAPSTSAVTNRGWTSVVGQKNPFNPPNPGATETARKPGVSVPERDELVGPFSSTVPDNWELD